MTHLVLTDRERSPGGHVRGALLPGMAMGVCCIAYNAIRRCPACVRLGRGGASWRSYAERGVERGHVQSPMQGLQLRMRWFQVIRHPCRSAESGSSVTIRSHLDMCSAGPACVMQLAYAAWAPLQGEVLTAAALPGAQIDEGEVEIPEE